MADRTLETTRGGGREAAATNGETPAPPAASPSKMKAWLPMIVTIASMPVLAFATTRYVLLPHVQKALLQQAAGATSSEPAAAASEKSGEGAAPDGKTLKVTVPLTKMLVNVAGTMGTRYLMASMTLVGSGPDFRTTVEGNRDQLMDLGTSAMSTKTIADLEKPGSRNVIRNELLNTFNNALGGPVIKEIYITEWAIQ